MDREILFRGKRTDNGEWVEGYYAALPTDEGEPEHIIVETFDDGDVLYHFPPVDPSTVGQYTGIMDRNGKRIFEGDVVKYGGGKYKVVFVSNPHAYFGLDMIQEFGEIWPFSHSVHAGIMSVIGNIYDNPETVEV